MRIVAIANQKGGVGKTTVTMQLAATLSRRHRVLAVDADGQSSSIWWADNIRRESPFCLAYCQDSIALGHLRELHSQYDYVVVDTPGGIEDRPVLEAVLDSADYVIVPLTPEPLAVVPTIRTIDGLIEPRHLRHGVLLNRIDARVSGQLATWRELIDTRYGYPRFATHLRQYKAQTDAPALGQLVTSLPDNRRTKGAISDITRLGLELVEQFSPSSTGAW